MILDGSTGSPRLLLVAGILGAVSAAIRENDYSHNQQQIPGEHFAKGIYRNDIKEVLFKSHQRFKPITDCIFITSESGPFVYTSKTDDEEVCGIYFMTDPNRKVEIHFISFDVPCEDRGLVSFIDGWELNKEVFPSEIDHRLPLKQRSTEFCGINTPRTFLSSQNAALIQYRIPKRGKGFTVFARYLRNVMPCNVLAASLSEPFTLRNYGRRINCTYTALYPSNVEVLALEVGVSNRVGSVHTVETGTLRKCDETNPRDQVQIGGSYGLDTSKMDIVDSICGLDSRPDYHGIVDYDVTSVRLVSSGYFDNSVTINMQPLRTEVLDPDLNI